MLMRYAITKAIRVGLGKANQHQQPRSKGDVGLAGA
jgi:hypothetical protein